MYNPRLELGFQFVAQFGSPSVLPYDCVVERLARLGVPHNRCLALVGDSDTGNDLAVDVERGYDFGDD